MKRIKHSLGPKAWACLESSNAFHLTNSRIQQSIASGDNKYQSPVTPQDRSPPTGALSPHLGRTADSEKAALGGRRRARERREGAGKPRLHEARRRGSQVGDRVEAKDEAKGEGGKGNGNGEGRSSSTSSSWDQRLSETAALVVNAVMWTMVTERERSIYCAAFAAHESDTARNEDDGEIYRATDATAQQQAARGTHDARSRRTAAEDSNPAATTAAGELRVSLASARRFIKNSPLIDGTFVLDADVDLTFKRREEVGRSTGRDQQCSVATIRSPVRRSAKGMGTVEASLANTNAALSLTRKLCEAVGCSDPALYGDIHPLAKARLCRKHRRNGMVDVGSRR